MPARFYMAALMTATFVCGSIAQASLTQESPETSMGFVARPLAIDQWYELKKTTLVQPMVKEGDSSTVNSPNHAVVLAAGLEVNIMDLSEDGAYALIGIDDDAITDENPDIDPENPVLMWVSLADILRGQPAEVDVLAMEPLVEEGVANDTTDEFAETDFAKSKGKTSARRKAGRKGKRKGRGATMTYCLKDVRLAAARFTKGKHIPRSVPRNAAAEAYGPYKRAGWHPIKYSSKVPKGTACFFGHGRTGCSGYCGHAAIKIGANAWKGAGIRTTPFISGRTLIGCLTPP